MTGKNSKRPTGIKIPFRLWYGLAAGFLVIPVIVFCLGYLRWYVGIPFAFCFAALSVVSVLECTKPAAGKSELASNAKDFFIPLR